MQSIYPYLSDDLTGQAAEPGSLLLSMPNILFPDFENVKTSIPAGQDAGLTVSLSLTIFPRPPGPFRKFLRPTIV
jgi:hypothetical protein